MHGKPIANQTGSHEINEQALGYDQLMQHLMPGSLRGHLASVLATHMI